MFLVAIAFTYGLTGTLNMADLDAQGCADVAAARPDDRRGAVALVAFGIKAAAFPGNAWLPASYHTPAVAVSALFGGLLTKVGAYALMRVLFGHAARQAAILLEPVIRSLAVATLVLAPLGALAQTNLRRAMGFLVIGGIGVIFAGLALGTRRASRARQSMRSMPC